MILWLLIICTIILVISTAEVQVWSFTLNRHAWWMKNHPKLERRCINYKSLFYTSTFTSVLSALTLFLWIYIIVMGCACSTVLFITMCLFCIAMGSTFILIGYLQLIAKLCGLKKYYYPPLSVWLCKLVNKFIG